MPPRNLRTTAIAAGLFLAAHNPVWAILPGWPYPAYNKADFDNPIGLSDSSQIPIINTCLEPMTIAVDTPRVTGGVLPTGIGFDQGCSLPPWKGQWYEVIATVPYTLTCGNGVKYKAETRLTATSTLKEGCDHRGRPETWQNHATIDNDGMIRGMWWNDEDGDAREIGFGIGFPGLKFDVASIKKSYLGATCVLPQYKGGKKKLTRPIAFIHGLDMGFDDTWGVQGAICSPLTESIKPKDGGSTQSRIKWNFEQTSGSYAINIDATVAFEGLCRSNVSQASWPGSWESDWKSLASFYVSPGTISASARGQWESLVNDNPPALRDVYVGDGNIRGSIIFWAPKEFASKVSILSIPSQIKEILGSKSIDGNEFTKLNLEFSVPISQFDWEHARQAKNSQSSQGKVNSDPASTDPYASGTAPDVISRMQHLQKGEEINANGIYFFNGYLWNADSAKSIQPLPWWNDAGAAFPSTQPGESWTLYQFLENTLDAHYGVGWRKDSSQTIDLVCHSRGGISLREMLANAGGKRPVSLGGDMPKGIANAANHIRKVVTVNTPHFGSVTTTDLKNLPPEYSDSHGQILRDSARTDITLADVTIDPSLLSRALVGTVVAWKGTGVVKDWFMETGDGKWFDGALSTAGVVTSPIWAPLSYLGSYAAASTADFRFQAQGSWLQITSIYATADWWGAEKKLTRIKDTIDITHKRMFTGRKKGAHLGLDSRQIIDLAGAYPTLPDGRDLNLQTLHSTVGGLGDMVRTILSENVGDICDFSSDLQNASCYGFAKSFEYGWVADLFVDNIDIQMPLIGFLDKWQKGYLARTDIAVGDESQKAVRKGGVWDPANHPGHFQEPRSYELRKFFTRGRFPDTLAPHGEMGISFSKEFLGHRFEAKPSVIGAPRLGHDIYCALAPDCSELLDLGGGVAQMPEGSRLKLTLKNSDGAAITAFLDTVTVKGEFQLSAIPSGSDIEGYILAAPDGTNLLTVQSRPEEGVRLTTPEGGLQLVPTGYSVRPRLERQGNVLVVKVKTWSGQEIVKSLPFQNLPASLIVGTLISDTTESRPLLVGKFNVDTSLRNPLPETQVRLWFREARGNDVRFSKPRIAVENYGKKAVKGLEFFYTFRADPAHPPVLDAPAGAPWSLVSRGGDLWDLRYFDPSVTLAPGAVWPTAAASLVSLHMGNNAQWNVFKDPSNDRNIGWIMPNQKILVRDGSGAILWGTRMDGNDPARPSVRKASAWTREAAVGERNVTKPELEVRNDGNVPLRNLKAIWYARLPANAPAKLETWYLPDTKAKLDSLGDGLWAIEWSLPRWIQPGEKIVGGSIGVHLPQWTPWNRTLSPSHFGEDGKWGANPWVIVKDEDGKVIWGNIPPLASLPRSPDTTSTDTLPTVDTAVPTQLSLGVEMRDDAPWEAIAVKPRVRITNLGKDTVHAFTFSFPYQTERNLEAMSFLWFPQDHCSMSLEANTLAVLKCQGISVAPGAMWPDATGATFGLYHTDWSTWDKSNDPAFANMGTSFSPAPSTVKVTP